MSLLSKAKSFNEITSILSGETFLLVKLNEIGGTSTPSVLAQNLNFTAARLSAILKALQNKNYVQRVENETDKRFLHVQITPQGKEYIERKVDKIIQNTAFVINQLGESDAQELIRLINKVIKIETAH